MGRGRVPRKFYCPECFVERYTITQRCMKCKTVVSLENWREADPNRKIVTITPLNRQQNPTNPKQERKIADFGQKPTETNTVSHVRQA